MSEEIWTWKLKSGKASRPAQIIVREIWWDTKSLTRPEKQKNTFLTETNFSLVLSFCFVNYIRIYISRSLKLKLKKAGNKTFCLSWSQTVHTGDEGSQIDPGLFKGSKYEGAQLQLVPH